jgi:hypothetical protein
MTVGRCQDALQRAARMSSDKTQRQSRKLIEVFNKLKPWFRLEPHSVVRSVYVAHLMTV